MLDIIRANERGRAHFGWLQSQHTFSFGDYYNPKQMGFSVLRVINDDQVAPGAGFSTHGHRNMEIISYVLAGTMAHKDSAGHEQLLPAGEFQLMSAGKGIYHSEYNASKTADLKFLQIWIEPNCKDTEPSYQQKAFSQAPGLNWVITPDGRDGTLQIKQNAAVAQLILAQQAALAMPLAANKAYYLHLIAGELSLNNHHLSAGDGVKLTGLDALMLQSHDTAVNALWFELPA